MSIILEHTITLDEGQVAIANSPKTFTPAVELTHDISMSDGKFSLIGLVVAPIGLELSHSIEMAESYHIANGTLSFTRGAWIRAFALPKVSGDDAQEITLEDLIAIRPQIYPESKGNPSEYIIAGYQLDANDISHAFVRFKGAL